MASIADRRAFAGYSKLLPRGTGPYWVMSVGPEHAKIDQDSIRHNVLINRLAKVAKKGMSKVDVAPKSGTKVELKPAKEESTEKERNSYAVEKILGHENQPTETYYTVRWYGYELQDDTVELTEHILHRFWKAS